MDCVIFQELSFVLPATRKKGWLAPCSCNCRDDGLQSGEDIIYLSVRGIHRFSIFHRRPDCSPKFLIPFRNSPLYVSLFDRNARA